MMLFFFDGLQNDIIYKVQVISYGDKWFFDSVFVLIIVMMDDNGKDLVLVLLLDNYILQLMKKFLYKIQNVKI